MLFVSLIHNQVSFFLLCFVTNMYFSSLDDGADNYLSLLLWVWAR